MIIIVVGMPGSGKDIFVQEAAKLGFSHIRMGDMVRLYAGESGIGPDDSSIGGFATIQREKFGPEIWAKRTLEKMPAGDVIIDGSRSLAEIQLFKSQFRDELRVIGIEAPQEMRFSRLKARGREDDPKAMKEFKSRDERELSWGLQEALENVDIKIINDKSLNEFRNECQAVLQEIIRQGKSF